MLKSKFLSFAGIILLFISAVEAVPQAVSGKISSKVAAGNLKPGRTYSFRVGNGTEWKHSRYIPNSLTEG